MFGLYHQIALALFAGFVLAELVLPGRAFPAPRLWRVRAALSTLVYFAVAWIIGGIDREAILILMRKKKVTD